MLRSFNNFSTRKTRSSWKRQGNLLHAQKICTKYAPPEYAPLNGAETAHILFLVVDY